MTDKATLGHRPAGAAADADAEDGGAEPRACALPGCAEPVSQVPDDLPRMFCGPAHRAAARQRSVHDAWQAATVAIDHPTGNDDADDEDDEDDNWGYPATPADTTRPHRRTGRRAAAGLAAAALIGGTLAGVLFTSLPQHPAASTAPVHSTPSRANQPDHYQLMAKGSAWAGNAERALAAVTQRLAALTRAEKSLVSLPAPQRGAKADALLRQVRRELAVLGRTQTSLSGGLTAWDVYQRATLELAGIKGELSYLRKSSPQGQNAGSTAAAGITNLTRSLATDQKTLTNQIDTLAANLSKTVTQPVASVPASNLLSQIRGIIPAALADAPSSRPASAAVPPSPAPTGAPTPTASTGSASALPAAQATASAAAGLAGKGIASVRAIIPGIRVSFQGRANLLTAAEAAARNAIREESRLLGPGESRQVTSLVHQILQWLGWQY